MTEFEIAIGSICMVIGCAPLIWAIQSWLFNRKYKRKNK